MANLSKKQHQVSETKHRLSKALYLLITERHYDEITIYHILDKADISRRTFYRYFNSKDDLMDFCLENFVDGYYHQRDNFILARKCRRCILSHFEFYVFKSIIHRIACQKWTFFTAIRKIK